MIIDAIFSRRFVDNLFVSLCLCWQLLVNSNQSFHADVDCRWKIVEVEDEQQQQQKMCLSCIRQSAVMPKCETSEPRNRNIKINFPLFPTNRLRYGFKIAE